MKVIESIYPNKAYPCRINHTGGNYSYTIYTCNNKYVTSNGTFSSLKGLLTDVQLFYEKIELSVPTLDDIVAAKVSIGKNFMVTRNHTGSYDITVKSNYDSPEVILMPNFTLEIAIQKAQQIYDWCQQQDNEIKDEQQSI